MELQRVGVDARERVVVATTTGRPGMLRIEENKAWPVLSRLSMSVSAEITLGGFKVRDLLALEVGGVVESEWQETEDVSVKTGGVQVGWSEFEVEDQQLLVRLTRLA